MCDQRCAPHRFQCNKCTNSFRTSSMLYQHGKIHNKYDRCGKIYYTELDLRLHSTNCHVVYTCHQCKIGYEKWSLLHEHFKQLSYHTKPEFTCCACKNMYFTAKLLQEYRKTHKRCTKCDEMFVSSAQLKEHFSDLHEQLLRCHMNHMNI